MAEINTLLSKQELTPADYKTLCAELASSKASLQTLAQLNYLTELVDDAALNDVIAKLPSLIRGKNIKGNDGIKFLEGLKSLEFASFQTGLMLGPYAIDVISDTYYGDRVHRLGFTLTKAGFVPPPLGTPTCKLFGSAIPYDVEVLNKTGLAAQRVVAHVQALSVHLDLTRLIVTTAYELVLKGLEDRILQLEILRGITTEIQAGFSRVLTRRYRSSEGGLSSSLAASGCDDMTDNIWADLSKDFRTGVTPDALALTSLASLLLPEDAEISDTLVGLMNQDTPGIDTSGVFESSTMSRYEQGSILPFVVVTGVQEFPTFRLAVVELHQAAKSHYGDRKLLIYVGARSPLHNNLDVGNILLRCGATIEAGVHFNAMESRVLYTRLSTVHPIGRLRIDEDYARREIRLEAKRLSIAEKKQNAAQLEQTRVRSKFKDLASGVRDKVVARGIDFTKSGMTFQEISVVVDSKVFATWLNQLNPSVLDDVELNDILRSCFETILGLHNGCLTSPGALSAGDAGITVTVNDVTAVVRYSETARGHARLTINDQRINKVEVIPVLLRMMCFQEQARFNTFLESVAKCSLRILGYIQNGIEFIVRSPLGGAQGTGLIHLNRTRGKNYIILTDEETITQADGTTATSKTETSVHVSNINKLISLSTSGGSAYYDRYTGYYQGTGNIQQLTDAIRDCIPDITQAQLRSLLRTSVQQYLEAVRRSQALFDKTAAKFKVTLVSNPFKTGGFTGKFYKVPGQSGNTYYIKEDDLGIYNSEGGHICIVDKGREMGNVVGRDRLVARIYAVALDSQTVSSINTLRSYVKGD